MEKQIKVGSAVVYVDENRVEHNALVTAVHGPSGPMAHAVSHDDGVTWVAGVRYSCINLLFVTDDESRRDQYGTQIDRKSSCVYITDNTARANCWRFADDVQAQPE